MELIHFSDCEGFIGPRTSAKLAADFDAWRDRAQDYAATLSDDELWFMQKYEEWSKAFHVASGGGAVDFH